MMYDRERIGAEHEMDADKQEKKIHARHDTSYHYLLSSKKLFLELLQSFVHRGWVEKIDETNIQEISRSLIQSNFECREADLIYQVKVNGEDVFFYLLLEMQSKVDFQMPYRLLIYQVELLRYWMQNQVEEETKRKGFRIPPIVPIVLYNGKSKWTASRQFRKRVANEEIFGTELIDFEYLLIDVVRYTEAELLSLTNAIGSIFFLDQTKEQEQLLQKLRKFMEIMQQLSKENQKLLNTWMNNMFELPKDYVRQFVQNTEEGGFEMGLKKVVDDIRREGRMEGKREGKREGERIGELKGKKEGKEEVAMHLINMGLDTSSIATATGFTVDRVEQLREQSRL
jgi:predicted transposase/invertase (TIGR01784 family)